MFNICEIRAYPTVVNEAYASIELQLPAPGTDPTNALNLNTPLYDNGNLLNDDSLCAINGNANDNTNQYLRMNFTGLKYVYAMVAIGQTRYSYGRFEEWSFSMPSAQPNAYATRDDMFGIETGISTHYHS